MAIFHDPDHLAVGSPLSPALVPGWGGDALILQPRVPTAASTTTTWEFSPGDHPENSRHLGVNGAPAGVTVETLNYAAAAQPELPVPLPPPDPFASHMRAEGSAPLGPGEAEFITPQRTAVQPGLTGGRLNVADVGAPGSQFSGRER